MWDAIFIMVISLVILAVFVVTWRFNRKYIDRAMRFQERQTELFEQQSVLLGQIIELLKKLDERK